MFEFLIFSWALTFGYVPMQVESVKHEIVKTENKRIATVAGIEISVMAFDRILLSTEIETFQYNVKDRFIFEPYRANYHVSADYFISDSFQVGISHECDHPIASGLGSKALYPVYQYASGETIMYVKIRGN